MAAFDLTLRVSQISPFSFFASSSALPIGKPSMLIRYVSFSLFVDKKLLTVLNRGRFRCCCHRLRDFRQENCHWSLHCSEWESRSSLSDAAVSEAPARDGAVQGCELFLTLLFAGGDQDCFPEGRLPRRSPVSSLCFSGFSAGEAVSAGFARSTTTICDWAMGVVKS